MNLKTVRTYNPLENLTIESLKISIRINENGLEEVNAEIDSGKSSSGITNRKRYFEKEIKIYNTELESRK